MDARSGIEQKMEHALACIEKTEYREAINLSKDIIDQNPHYVDAYRLCGQAYFYLCDNNRAISFFDSALSLDRQHESTLVWRALAYIEIQRFGKAIKDLSDAININPAVAYLYQRGLAYLALNDCEKALVDIKQVLMLEPDDVDAQNALESCLMAIIKNDLLIQFKKDEIDSAIKLLPECMQLKITKEIDRKSPVTRHSFWAVNVVSAATISSLPSVKK